MKLSTMLLPPIALTLASTASAAIQGKLINNCKFPVWAKTTHGGGYDSHEMARVNPGGVYRAKVQTINNAPGVALKVQPSPDPAWRNVYQAEMAQSDTADGGGGGGWAWCDLSTVDAAPFRDRWRRLEVAGGRPGCRVLEYPPGRADCEWPVPRRGEMGDCRAGPDAEVVFTLCRK
ncbi:BYS1 domain protein [Neofusicoccum parvum]|nr:BYS1 domain protein [Neofusicoccum parvum]